MPGVSDKLAKALARPAKTRKGKKILERRQGDKNFQKAKFWYLWSNIGRIELIRYVLGSGQRDLSVGDIGCRVYDFKT